MIKIRLLFAGTEQKVVELDKAEITIGRTPENDVQIDNIGVSKLHARILRRGDDFVLEDCNSTNGTLLNGKPVTSAAISTGDTAEILKYLLVFTLDRGDEGDEGNELAYPQTVKL